MTGFTIIVSGSSMPRHNAMWVSEDDGVTWSGPMHLGSHTEDAGYGSQALWDETNNYFAIVTYHGSQTEASIKQYKVSLYGVGQ